MSYVVRSNASRALRWPPGPAAAKLSPGGAIPKNSVLVYEVTLASIG